VESRILKIDLSSRAYEVEEIAGKVVGQYLGGRGLGAYLLYRLVPSKADPMSSIVTLPKTYFTLDKMYKQKAIVVDAHFIDFLGIYNKRNLFIGKV